MENYYILTCPEWMITQAFIDKKYTYKLAESIGIPAPKTISPRDKNDVEEYAESATYPCLIKPCQSHRYFEVFRRKMLKVKDVDELMSAYNQASEAHMEVLLQEYIPGDDSSGVNYNSYFWDNKPLVEFTAQKVRLSPPEFGVPGVLISKHIPECITPGRKILQALGYNGYSCTEFKKDERDGVYKFMEVNGRHNRSSLLSVRCGINFPLIEYNHRVLGKMMSTNNYKKEIYWIDLTKDLAAGIQYRKRLGFSLIQYIKPYLRPNTFAVLSINDPMPFIKRCIDILGMVWRAIFKIDKPEEQSQTMLLGEDV